MHRPSGYNPAPSRNTAKVAFAVMMVLRGAAGGWHTHSAPRLDPLVTLLNDIASLLRATPATHLHTSGGGGIRHALKAARNALSWVIPHQSRSRPGSDGRAPGISSYETPGVVLWTSVARPEAGASQKQGMRVVGPDEGRT